jgi:hypothetical protein
MRLITVLMLLLTACRHEQLDFALPDGGHGDGDAGARSATKVGCARAASCRESSDSAVFSQGSLDEAGPADSADSAGGGASAEGTGTNSAPDPQTAPAERYQDDPLGYPTGPGQRAAYCGQGQSFEEVCGNDLDDDCDGMVDEYPGIGASCSGACRVGIYVCSTSTHTLLCQGAQGCKNAVPAACGDGFVGSDEACDPNAPSETPGVTCTLTCDRPLFVPCVQAGVVFPELCDDLHVCNERIGACVPVLGPRQRRCPQLRIEGSASADEFYPMLEVENGECWVTCSESEQCPSSLSDCYMGFCVVPF